MFKIKNTTNELPFSFQKPLYESFTQRKFDSLQIRSFHDKPKITYILTQQKTIVEKDKTCIFSERCIQKSNISNKSYLNTYLPLSLNKIFRAWLNDGALNHSSPLMHSNNRQTVILKKNCWSICSCDHVWFPCGFCVVFVQSTCISNFHVWCII